MTNITDLQSEADRLNRELLALLGDLRGSPDSFVSDLNALDALRAKLLDLQRTVERAGEQIVRHRITTRQASVAIISA